MVLPVFHAGVLSCFCMFCFEPNMTIKFIIYSCTPSVNLERLKIPLTLLCSGVSSNPCHWISGLAHWPWTQSHVHVSARLIQLSAVTKHLFSKFLCWILLYIIFFVFTASLAKMLKVQECPQYAGFCYLAQARSVRWMDIFYVCIHDDR